MPPMKKNYSDIVLTRNDVQRLQTWFDLLENKTKGDGKVYVKLTLLEKKLAQITKYEHKDICQGDEIDLMRALAHEQ